MTRQTRKSLSERVVMAAEAALAEGGYVSPIDIFVGIGWIHDGMVESWRRGQSDCLEDLLQANPSRIADAMELFWAWAKGRGLSPGETAYVARTPQRQALRFSKSGEPTIERLFRTHWVSPELPEKKREALAEKASRAPELVVIQPLKSDWTCHRCGKTGDLLMMENPGPACLSCLGLGDLDYLPAGDALLTRRAKAKSERYAVVVRFSRSRKRYERRGLLVEPQALIEAERELAVSRGAQSSG
jgi:hypothetical protein